MVHDGTMCELTGTSTVGTTTTIVCMGARVGRGEGSDALECTSTDCAPCIEITRDTGEESDPIGICGAETITTGGRDGSGVDTAELDVTCIVCAS